MNKRIGVVALAVLMLLSVTACGGAKYSKGTLSDNGFESEWMGIRFNAPEGYVVATQEELDNFISMGQDYVKAVYEENGKKVIDYTEVEQQEHGSPADKENWRASLAPLPGRWHR